MLRSSLALQVLEHDSSRTSIWNREGEKREQHAQDTYAPIGVHAYRPFLRCFRFQIALIIRLSEMKDCPSQCCSTMHRRLREVRGMGIKTVYAPIKRSKFEYCNVIWVDIQKYETFTTTCWIWKGDQRANIEKCET